MAKLPVNHRVSQVARFILKELDVHVELTTLEVNCYDEEENTIYMNRFSGSPVGTLVKFVYKRPVEKEWSLYHELGHAFFYLQSLERNGKARKLFGNFSADYPEDGLAEARKIEEIPDGFLSAYASVHPEEDFAECFAYVLLNYNKDYWEGIDDKTTAKVEFVLHHVSKFLHDKKFSGKIWMPE